MREIPLSKGYVALVDDEDYEHVALLKWHAHEHRSKVDGSVFKVYAESSQRISAKPYRFRKLSLHRVILGVTDAKIEVDHENGNGLDCRKRNLRQATRRQNQWNKGKPCQGKSPYKGVTFHRSTGKWQARICTERGRLSLGLFDTDEEAGIAYDAAALQYHGEFAQLNGIEER